MMMPPKNYRAADDPEERPWRFRVTPFTVKLLFTLLGALASMGVMRMVPGGVVVGSVADLHTLATRFDSADASIRSQHKSFAHEDSVIELRLDKVEAAMVYNAEKNKADIRKNCDELGFRRAHAYGYRCSDGDITPPKP